MCWGLVGIGGALIKRFWSHKELITRSLSLGYKSRAYYEGPSRCLIVIRFGNYTNLAGRNGVCALELVLIIFQWSSLFVQKTRGRQGC